MNDCNTFELVRLSVELNIVTFYLDDKRETGDWPFDLDTLSFLDKQKFMQPINLDAKLQPAQSFSKNMKDDAHPSFYINLLSVFFKVCFASIIVSSSLPHETINHGDLVPISYTYL